MNFWEFLASVVLTVLCTPFGWIGLIILAFVIGVLKS